MTVLLRAGIAALVLGPLALTGLGVGNAVAFNSRASALEQSWSAAQAAGVTHAQLAPARDSLRALRERRVVFLPYSVFSGALFADPFGQAQGLAARGQADALAAARERVNDDLARLKEVGGPNYSGYQRHAEALTAAHQLIDYVRLARAWEREAAQLTAARDQLSTAAGGLSEGLPRDVVDGVARLQSVITAATDVQLSTDPAAQALAHGQDYLKQQYPKQLEQHDGIMAEVRSAGDTVQHRVDVRILANQLVGRLPQLLSQAVKYGVGADYQSRATQAKADLLAAQSSSDDGRIESSTTALKQAVDRLSGAVTAAQKAAQAAALAAGSGCIEGAGAQLIVIHLVTQKLVAYNNGCPFLTTLVTTGRPAARTYPGTFSIHRKETSHLMHSPWPEGDPLWYPDTTVHNAMLIVPADGVYIHSAEWQPESTYGPGSENGSYASHGCIHVMNGPLASLYNWAQIGTTVIITD